ncbi:hypothetical protein IV203_000738 [Nitzschia inconspicua]|uniref:Uncharacterized protein n=1 Tax=Nitzschia inconspicua TaxID=303405 RepID=A0A9K3PQI1_9STRA|nr:hypothetical protein IV203_000738 [Nitzschia inconspicua]
MSSAILIEARNARRREVVCLRIDVKWSEFFTAVRNVSVTDLSKAFTVDEVDDVSLVVDVILGGDIALSKVSCAARSDGSFALLLLPLTLVSERPIGPAVNAAKRDNLDTCAIDRGANISYDTLVEEEVLGLGADTGGETDEEAMVDGGFCAHKTV